MKEMLLKFLLKLFTSEATKTLIAVGVNKLLESKSDGITKDIAKTMIDGVAKSQMNPTTDDVFKDSLKLLN